MPKLDRFETLPTMTYGGGIALSEIGDENTKFVVYDSAASYPAHIVTIQGGSDTEDHFNRLAAIAPTIGAIGVCSLHDCELRNLAFLFIDGKLIDGSDLIPDYVRDQIDSTGPWNITSPLPVRTVEGLSLVAVSVVHDVYGHWLLDILPRIWLAKRSIKNFENITIILPHGTPQFASDILSEFFGSTKITHHAFADEHLRIKQALLPSLLHNSHYFHPAMNDFVAWLLDHPLIAQARKDHKGSKLVYVTRQEFRHTSRSYARTIVNEDEVLELMNTLGFQIVRPENMKWQDQIALFASARVIIGESGSGLHNTLFSSAGTAVVCLNPVNQVQSSIAGLRRHTLINQCSTSEEANSVLSYRVDIDGLHDAALAAMHSTGEVFDRPAPISHSASKPRAGHGPDDSLSPAIGLHGRASWLGGFFSTARHAVMLGKGSLAALLRR